MKNWRLILLYLLLVALPIWSTGCSDDPTEPGTESPVTPTPTPDPDGAEGYYDPWILGEYMNPDIHPGDNFFFYCNGTWYESVKGNTNQGIENESALKAARELLALDAPFIDQLEMNAKRVDETVAVAQALMKEHSDELYDKYAWTSSHENLMRGLAYLTNQGYTNLLFDFNLVPVDGEARLMISMSESAGGDEGEGDEQEQMHLQTLCRMGFTPDEAEQINAQSRQVLNRINIGPWRDYSALSLSRNPELSQYIVKASDMTRGQGENLLNAYIEELGIDGNWVVCDGVMIQAMDQLAQIPVTDLADMITQMISNTLGIGFSGQALDLFLNQSAQPMLGELSFREKLIFSMASSYLSYPLSKAYVETYVTAADKQLIEQYSELIRESFDKRIDKLDWISEATRVKAKEKLQAIYIEVFYPEKWIEEGIPQLGGASLFHDLLAANKACLAAKLACMGKPSRGVLYNNHLLGGGSTFESNAFYSPQFNGVAILPPILREPIFDSSKPDAYNFAALATISHELTHGFDSNGSRFDAQGNLNDWWTASDRSEFESRLQKLVACFSELEVYPGLYNNGEMTLDENIADLGGVLIARDALLDKLREQGATEQELQAEERHFFQAYANTERNFLTNESMLDNTQNDEHSCSKERVNGVLRNIDSWYELYEVDAEKMLYLAPEERTYIW